MNEVEWTRRQFLLTAAEASLATAFSWAADPGWFERPMRWAQLVFTEDDPANPRFDPRFWIELFARTHCDAVNLSAGGCVAYYPTRIPYHHRSRWLGSRDLFGEFYEACRKLGMVVVARTDPHSVTDEAAQAHPEWIQRLPDGSLRPHWATPGRWVTCALGPYNFEFMTEVHREIVSLYRVDGIFANRWSGHGICYCEFCQRAFYDRHHRPLPQREDPSDPSWNLYRLWRQERLFELWQLWDRAIRDIHPAARFIANAGGGALSPLDMKTIGQLAETLFADRQARSGLIPPWAAGKNAKEFRAALGTKPVAGITSVGFEERYRWKDSVQSPVELQLWMADGVANGLRPWFVKFGGVVYDDRWVRPIEEFYRWHHRCERYLRNEQPLARVAMVYSQKTAWYYGGREARARVEDHILGFYHALIEARIPFEMVHDGLLDTVTPERYRTLVLPNIAALSDAECDALRQFVHSGGSLVATFETSLYDEFGRRRRDFGLADLFGVSWTGRSETGIRNAYLTLRADPVTGRRHPLLNGLEDARRIIYGTQRVDVRPLQQSLPAPLTLVPSYPDLPMEEVYPRQPETDIAEVYLQEIGPGRVVYFPWDIDRTFWEILAVEHGKLLANAVRWATNEPPLVEVLGPGLIEVTIWRQKNSVTIHLVNLTNPMAMKGPCREVIPIGPLKVRVRLPGSAKLRKAHLLVQGEPVQVRRNEDVWELAVPSVGIHEVVALDLAS